MKEFGRYHPVVSFLYFVFTIGFSMFYMHPLCLAISLVCGFTFSVMLKGKGAIKTNLVYMLPVVVLTAVINPLFNHQGVTVLGYLLDGNALTAESIVYGISAAVMIVSVICWFTCYNQIMTSDKFVYLFGRVIPSLSMIFSMVLRFVPKFATHLKEVTAAQKCIGRDISQGSIIKRAKNGLAILSIMITWSLENAIQTADSMKSRGYGLKGRTAFSVFTFDKRDVTALLWIVAMALYTFVGSSLGGMYYSYFPYVKYANFTPYGTSVFCTYFALCIYPVITQVWEVRRWKAIKSKI